MSADIPDDYPELLADLIVQLARQLEKANLAPARAGALAFALAEYAREHWSGFPIYMPQEGQAVTGNGTGDFFGGEAAGVEPDTGESDALYVELLAELARELSARLVREGLDEAAARAQGAQLSRLVRRHWGGQSIYIPRGVRYESDTLSRRIFDKYRGNNHVQLAREFGVTVMWVYKCVARQRVKILGKIQGRLF